MFGKKTFKLAMPALLMLLVTAAAIAEKPCDGKEEKPMNASAVLWRSPSDIKSRNLFYGPGGEQDAPPKTVTFENEDMDGTSPKFLAHDEKGVKWKVKMGPEARPETVAARLVWAVGYFTNEDYFLPELQVQAMPARLRRGRHFVNSDGTAHNVRLKRYLQDEMRVGPWHWRDNPFGNTRELNGLKVMMALINNWDLKDDNNSVYHESRPAENVFMVSDLGASFGTTGLGWTGNAKGNLASYRRSKFITQVAPKYVDFNLPTRAAIIRIFDPPEYTMRLRLRWVCKHIPREDVRWIDQLLTQLSGGQIRDAFRAAGYSPDQVEGFSKIVEKRIAELGGI